MLCEAGRADTELIAASTELAGMGPKAIVTLTGAWRFPSLQEHVTKVLSGAFTSVDKRENSVSIGARDRFHPTSKGENEMTSNTASLSWFACLLPRRYMDA